MQSPFICKISFYKPTPMNAKKNSAHLNYIGTRPGVSLEKQELTLDATEVDAAHHVKYAGERPGSHGLFSQKEDEKISLTDTQKELKEHRGNVWRMILSLKEEDSVNIGYTNREKWETMLRATVPDAAKEMGIKESNLRWVAAFHEEKGHPHVHLVLWEKEPDKKRGALSKREFHKVKNTFVKEIYQEERMNLNLQKTEERNFIRELSKDITIDAVQLRKQLGNIYSFNDNELLTTTVNITPKMHTHDLKEFYRQLALLSENMPQKGRMTFKFMPTDVKQQTLKLADWLINRPQFSTSLESYKQAAENLAKYHLKEPDKIALSVDKAVTDLKVRISQVLLKGAHEYRRTEYLSLHRPSVEKAIKQYGKAKTTYALNEKQLVRDFAKTLYSMNVPEIQVENIIDNWLKRSPNLEIGKEEVKNVLKRTYKQVGEERRWGNRVVVSQKTHSVLNQQLQVNAPYPFKTLSGPTHSASLMQTMWKSAFRELENEKMRKEAEVNMQKRKRERMKAKQLQNEKDREDR